MRADALAVGGIDHGEKEVRGGVARFGAQFVENAQEPFRLQLREIAGELCAFGGWIKQALSAILSAGAGLDKSQIEQLLENAVQALLGDLQNVEQGGDGEPGPTADEVQHAMVRAPEIIIFEQAVSVADKVAVSEKEEFDEIEHRFIHANFVRPPSGAGRRLSGKDRFLSGRLTVHAAPHADFVLRPRWVADRSPNHIGMARYVSYIDIIPAAG